MDSFSDLPVLLVERAAIPLFGFKAYGVHINGFVRDAETKKIMLWVAKRSKTKSTFPGQKVGILDLKCTYATILSFIELICLNRFIPNFLQVVLILFLLLNKLFAV